MVQYAGREEKEQIETLIAGGAIEVPVHEDITYDDMEKRGEVLLCLIIPNMEIRTVYERTIRQWYKKELEQSDFHNLYKALEEGNTKDEQEMIDEQLKRSISCFDSAENFFHGFMTGVLNQSSQYHVKSNRESGDGRSDIMIVPVDMKRKAFVLELKVSDRFQNREQDAQRAVEQIREKRYGEELMEMGYNTVDIYGIAFYRQNCSVIYGGRYKGKVS